MRNVSVNTRHRSNSHHPLSHPSSFAYPLMKNSFQMCVHMCNINVCCSVSTRIKKIHVFACRTVDAATPVKVKAVIQHWSKVE